MSSKETYRVCFCFRRRFRLAAAEAPAEIKDLFHQYSENGIMTVAHLQRFLIEVQREDKATLELAQGVMDSLHELKILNIFHRKGLNLETFFKYLFADINPPLSTLGVYHDMNAPLSHYFIFTGHNSYLTGNQLSSDCSDVPIIKALQEGVRVIELDIWPNSTGDNVDVLHGSPEPDVVGETISTLKFAERVATVELGAARVNKDSSDVKELKEQIVSLKAALARKEREPEPLQCMLSGSPCGISSPFQSDPQSGDIFTDPNDRKKPMGDLGNIEVRNNYLMRQKRQSFDLDELLGNSPPWPPVSIPSQQYDEEDRDMMGLGDWVDKVMVNKQKATRRVENPLGCWEAENFD